MSMLMLMSILYFLILFFTFLLFVTAFRPFWYFGLSIVLMIYFGSFLFHFQVVMFVGVFIIVLLLTIHLLSQLYIPNYLHILTPILPQSSPNPIPTQHPLKHLPQIPKYPLPPIKLLFPLNLQCQHFQLIHIITSKMINWPILNIMNKKLCNFRIRLYS